MAEMRNRKKKVPTRTPKIDINSNIVTAIANGPKEYPSTQTTWKIDLYTPRHINNSLKLSSISKDYKLDCKELYTDSLTFEHYSQQCAYK
jgi:hypothetical protein